MFTAAKTAFATNLRPKTAIFYACVQMFGKNLMLQVHAILLRNQLLTVHTCNVAQSGVQAAELTCAVSMLPTLAKCIAPWSICKIVALPKLLVIFLNLKKI